MKKSEIDSLKTQIDAFAKVEKDEEILGKLRGASQNLKYASDRALVLERDAGMKIMAKRP